MKSVSPFVLLLLTSLAVLQARVVVAGEFPEDWYWGDAEQRAAQASLEGEPAPELILTDWMNGEPSAEAMEGKIVVLDFWATWCGDIYFRNTPYMNQLSEIYAEHDVVVMGVCGSTDQERFAEVVEEAGMKYPVARDASGKNAQRWNVLWWPTYAVVDREGKLRAVGLKSTWVEPVVKSLLEAEGVVFDEAEEETSFDADAESTEGSDQE